jgi:hypothetical protein
VTTLLALFAGTATAIKKNENVSLILRGQILKPVS